MLNPSTHSRTYPPSYYEASLTDKEGFPQAKGALSTQVCIIGGGFSGASTALELRERGINVILVEAYRIGWGASGRNGGQLIRGIGHGLDQFKNQIGTEGIKAIDDMGFEAVDIVKQRVEKYAIDCDLKWGYCDLATKPRHLKDFIEDKEWL
ncbi:FAD-binding oxidoreductase, partial [Oleiphilus sp. HI0080]